MTNPAVIGIKTAQSMRPVEGIVLDQMREVLRSPELTPTDHFFESGGDSVLAAGLAGRLRRITGLDLPISYVFTYPTAEELGAALAEESMEGLKS